MGARPHKSASAGKRTRVTSMATMYTRPLMLMCTAIPKGSSIIHQTLPAPHTQNGAPLLAEPAGACNASGPALQRLGSSLQIRYGLAD